MIDIIIPVYNEYEFLREHQAYYEALGRLYPIIFVDGGSQDQTVEIARKYGRVILSKKGRAIQKNVGAQNSKADFLLFLHVDVCIDQQLIIDAVNVLSSGVVVGCFQMKINHEGWIFRIFEWFVNMRARQWFVTDGDLGLFVKRCDFLEVGGFPKVDVMEDVLIGRKFQKFKRKRCVLLGGINVSTRKWDENGFWKLIGQYIYFYLKFYSGQIKGEKT